MSYDQGSYEREEEEVRKAFAAKDAEIAELRKDAERYRWIRDRLGMDISVLSAQGEYQRKWLGGSLLDDVIDAKRSKPSE